MTEKPDYMQMARDARWLVHRDMRTLSSLDAGIFAHARTLAALDTERTAHEATKAEVLDYMVKWAEDGQRADKAEAELRALREAAKALLYFIGPNDTRVYASDAPVAALRSLLPQPAADPLDQVLESLPANFGNCVDGSTALREALARHGLTITEKQG